MKESAGLEPGMATSTQPLVTKQYTMSKSLPEGTRLKAEPESDKQIQVLYWICVGQKKVCLSVSRVMPSISHGHDYLGRDFKNNTGKEPKSTFSRVCLHSPVKYNHCSFENSELFWQGASCWEICWVSFHDNIQEDFAMVLPIRITTEIQYPINHRKWISK